LSSTSSNFRQGIETAYGSPTRRAGAHRSADYPAQLRSRMRLANPYGQIDTILEIAHK